MPLIPARLALVKLFIELSLYTPALLVLHGIMSSDDQEVEAWYLEGWCFHLMSEQAQESGGFIDGLTWQELAKDSRDCLETCQVVSYIYKLSKSISTFNPFSQSCIVIKTIMTNLYWNIPRNLQKSWIAWASLRLLQMTEMERRTRMVIGALMMMTRAWTEMAMSRCSKDFNGNGLVSAG